MKNFTRSIAVVTTLTACAIIPGSFAIAQDIKERTIKLATVNTEDSSQGLGGKRFAELVDKKSGGKIKVRLFAGGSLGGEVQVASSLQGGTIEMSMIAPGLLTGMDKDFGVFDTPFLFDNDKEVDAVLDGPVGKKLLDKLPEKGLIGLTYWDVGFRVLTTSRHPVSKAEDIQGMKIRVPQIPVYIEAFNGLGANAVALPFPELYTALETKTVDGQENPFVSLEVTKFYEVQKYASNTRHAYTQSILLASKKFWDRLSDDERKILVEAANETTPYQREISRNMNKQAVETLKSKGMTITEISPQERTRMREKLKPVIEKHNKTINETLVSELNTELEKVRTAR